MISPAHALGDVLVRDGVAHRVDGPDRGDWPLYFAKEPSGANSPDACVTIYNTGGPPGSPKWLLDFPRVQVRVRGAPNKYLESRAKVLECKDALLGIDSFDALDGSGDRIVSVTLGTEIMDMAPDEKNRPLHVFNLNMIVEPAEGKNRLPIS